MEEMGFEYILKSPHINHILITGFTTREILGSQ